MHYGHPPHIAHPDDLTILACSCGWYSSELKGPEMQARGLPWYCDRCGKQSLYFVKFHPRERDRAWRAIGLRR